MNVRGVTKAVVPRPRRAYYWVIERGRGDIVYSTLRMAMKDWGTILPGHRAVLMRKDKDDPSYTVTVATLPEE